MSPRMFVIASRRHCDVIALSCPWLQNIHIPLDSYTLIIRLKTLNSIEYGDLKYQWLLYVPPR